MSGLHIVGKCAAPLLRPAVRQERQAHGFHYQNEVIRRLNLREIPRYTAEYDAECQGTPVQIKCMKWGTGIQLGDYLRNKNKKHDFLMIVGFWDESKYSIAHEEVRYITCNHYTDNIGFHDPGNEIEKMMYEEMRSISNCPLDDKIWEEYRRKYRELWPGSNHINIRFLRDKKTQKRIQCGITWNNYQHWYKEQFCEIRL